MRPKNRHSRGRLHPALILIGVCALLFGALVYLLDRPPESTFFVREYLPQWRLHEKLPPVFGKLGTILPDFIHPFSLSLITAGLVARSLRGGLIACMFWFTVNSLFELGQLFQSFAVAMVPGWFEHIPILSNCKRFFINGTFDPLDLGAMFLGAFAAFCVMIPFYRKN